MQRDIVDVTVNTFGINEIIPFIHRNRKIPETLAAQKRLLRKWKLRSQDLHGACSRDPKIISNWQLEQISRIVDFAYSSHPFYFKLYSEAGFIKGDIIHWSDYHALPTIDKSKIVENFDLFIQPYLSSSREPCYSAITSGSSGKILTAMFDQAMIDEDILRCLRFYEQVLGRPRGESEWLYQIYVDAPPFTTLDGAFPIFSTSIDCPAEIVLRHLLQIKPCILTGLPSYLLRLGELVTNPYLLGIRSIITNSEASTEAERNKIAALFGCPVFDEYSSVELGLIATQCSQGRYHVTEDNVRVDVENANEFGFGQIVTTSLINSYMPFIRYYQGDLIQVENEPVLCPCGSTFRYLNSFLGRTDQNLQSSVIGNVPSDRIMALYDRTLLWPDANISEFQIVQHELDQIELLLVARKREEGVNHKIVSLFCDEIKKLFCSDNLIIKWSHLDALPIEKSYKRRLIKNNIRG